MALHAVDDLEDALAATRAFLLPFDAGRWLRLAIVAFFVGGVGTAPTSGFQFGGEPTVPGAGEPTLPDLSGQVLGLILLVGAALLAFGLVLGFVGSVMEFVLVTSLRDEEVHVRRYFRDHWRAGARLFGFRIVLTLLAAALVLGPVLALVFGSGGIAAVDGPGEILGLVLILIPLAFVVGTVFSLVNGFTTLFVVPVMLLEGRGVLAAWRRFSRTLRAEWKEYLLFAVLTFVLTLVVGTAVGIVVGIVALLVAVPFVALGIAGVVTAGAFGPGGIGALSLPVLLLVGALALVAFLVVMVAAALVRVPVMTYFRYYALLVLGDTDEDLDLVPERRRTIRAGSGDADEGGSGAESA